MAGARGAKGITTRPISRAALSPDTLHNIGDIFAEAALGFFRNSELAADLHGMQEQWIAETETLLKEVYDQPSQIEPILRSQLKKLHGYIYVDTAPAVSGN